MAAAPTKLNFKMYQGSTFKEVIRWETDTKVYVPITMISKSAPMVVTAPNHGIPVGWRTKITNVVGMKEVNNLDKYHVVSSANPTQVTINATNSIDYQDYVSGGVLEYNQPVDLIEFTGRMQIRQKLDSETVLLELATENGGIVINNVNKTIGIVITSEQTAEFQTASSVYSLELVDSVNTVIPLCSGTITLIKEVTR